MFVCGICGRGFDNVAECWEHTEACGEAPEGGARVPCPDCGATGLDPVDKGAEWARDCGWCDGTGKTVVSCLRCWDRGIVGAGPVASLPACDCAGGLAAREAGTGIRAN